MYIVEQRGKATQKATCLVDRRWFLFMDIDVTLFKREFKKARRFIKPDVSAIWELEV